MKQFKGLKYIDKDGVLWERDRDGGVILNCVAHLVNSLAGWLWKISGDYVLWTRLEKILEDDDVQS